MTNAEYSADQVRRSVVQRLEDLRRSGVTHWKKIKPVLVPPVSGTLVSSSQRSGNLTAVPARSQDPISVAAMPAPIHDASSSVSSLISIAKTNLFDELASSELAKKKTIAPSTSPPACVTFQPLDLPLAERVSGLAALAQRVATCTRCQELAATRTQTVFGVGNPQAKILFIGEAPGADEDKQGEPFVGRAGQLLNDVIKACRLRREDIYNCHTRNKSSDYFRSGTQSINF